MRNYVLPQLTKPIGHIVITYLCKSSACCYLKSKLSPIHIVCSLCSPDDKIKEAIFIALMVGIIMVKWDQDSYIPS